MIILLGPTGVGKDTIIEALWEKYKPHLEFLSIDSMKVYRGMDIGTSKSSPVLLEQAPFHLIDIKSHAEEFHAYEFYTEASRTISQTTQRKKLLVGIVGTPLYLKALLYGLFKGPPRDDVLRAELAQKAEAWGWPTLYEELQRLDPAYATKISPSDQKRIIRALEVYAKTGVPFSSFHTQFDQAKPMLEATLIGVTLPRRILYERVEQRVRTMLQEGLIDEVRKLLDQAPFSRTASEAIGYREVMAYFNHQLAYEELPIEIARHTKRYVKHQLTWFKKMPVSQWLDLQDTGERLSRFFIEVERELYFIQ